MQNKNYDPQSDVAIFMRAGDQEVKDYPHIPSGDVLLLRARLIFEEAMEFIFAAGCHIITDDSGNLKVFTLQGLAPDIVDMADALSDLNYVSYGAANALGIKLYPVHDEVQRSNMTKLVDGKTVKNEYGKVQKPKTFQSPDIKSVLEKQGWQE